MKGKIKMTKLDKGFGFIEAEDGAEYFFHKSALQNVKFEELSRGREVEFEVGEGAKGPRAEDIYA